MVEIGSALQSGQREWDLLTSQREDLCFYAAPCRRRAAGGVGGSWACMVEDGTRISKLVQRMMCLFVSFLWDNSFEVYQLELGCQEMLGSTDLGRWVVGENGMGTALAESARHQFVRGVFDRLAV
jgi:hypothetical protein